MADNKINLTSEDYTSCDFLFICFSMLESRGYAGWNELISVLNDYKAIIKILRLFSGMTIKIPTLKEFRECLMASTYVFCDLSKRNDKLLKTIPSVDKIDEYINPTLEEKEKIQKLYDEWIEYMEKQGYPIDKLYDVTRADTKRRFKNIRSKLYMKPKIKSKRSRK